MYVAQNEHFNRCSFSAMKLQSNAVIGDTSGLLTITSLTIASFAKQLDDFLKNVCLCELRIKGVLLFFIVHTTDIDLH